MKPTRHAVAKGQPGAIFCKCDMRRIERWKHASKIHEMTSRGLRCRGRGVLPTRGESCLDCNSLNSQVTKTKS